jgi:hypothetical protein
MDLTQLPFTPGDYRCADEAVRDAVNRLAAFDDTAKIIAQNTITQLIMHQDGDINCYEVTAIASAIANAIQGQTYGQTLLPAT